MPTSSILALCALAAIVVGVIFYQFFWPGIRLRRIRKRPFPDSWQVLLPKVLPIYGGLAAKEQEQLQNLVKQFLADKLIIGCGGLEIDDEIRLAIAANACLLLLNRTSGCYPELHSILVYPSTFRVTREHRDQLGLVSLQDSALLGESWSEGKIILAWDEVRRGVTNFQDGENVVFHEFAHELDHEDGVSNGAPILHTRGAYQNWARVFAEEFSSLQEMANLDRQEVLDHYGATNPAEFFAVATETFFERPIELQALHGELYEQLANFYRVNPVLWVQHKGESGR